MHQSQLPAAKGKQNARCKRILSTLSSQCMRTAHAGVMASGLHVTAQVLEGSEPNEHGTWQYGRGGWCDGQEVTPTHLLSLPYFCLGSANALW